MNQLIVQDLYVMRQYNKSSYRILRKPAQTNCLSKSLVLLHQTNDV